MFSSRKKADVAARLASLTTELEGLQTASAQLNGAALDKAVAAHQSLMTTATRLKDTLAAARAAQDALPVEDWDKAVRLPLWRDATDPSTQTNVANGARVGEGVHLFHDCPLAEISLSQTAQDTGAPFGIKLEVFSFDGSFLSLAIDLPDAVTQQVTPTQVVRATLNRALDKGGDLYVRLNIQSGPNTEQITRTLSGDDGVGWVEFDLDYVSELSGRVIDKMWMDVMIEKPAHNQIVLRDVTVAHRRRADM